MTPSQTVTLSARGHPNVKASHPKTLEWVPEPDLGPRGTCILGVSLSGDLDALARLRGRATFVVRCAGAAVQVEATLNPAWLPGEPLIVRRAPEPSARRTLAFAADAGAADLDRGLAARLADPAAETTLEVRSHGEPHPGCLFLAHPAGADSDRLRAARRLADLISAGDTAGLEAAIRAGGRVLLETDDAALRAGAVRQVHALGGLTTLIGGWTPEAGAEALAGLETPLSGRALGWPSGKRARRIVAEALAGLPGGAVLALPPGQAEPLLPLCAKAFGPRPAALVVDPGGPHEAVRRDRLEALAHARPPERAAWLVVDAPPGAAETSVDPQLLDLVRRLRAEGVGTKTLAAALAETVGMPKRDAFNLLVKLEEKGPSI
jgi:hypothetical protein